MILFTPVKSEQSPKNEKETDVGVTTKRNKQIKDLWRITTGMRILSCDIHVHV